VAAERKQIFHGISGSRRPHLPSGAREPLQKKCADRPAVGGLWTYKRRAGTPRAEAGTPSDPLSHGMARRNLWEPFGLGNR
jgi:hypothetical protein